MTADQQAALLIAEIIKRHTVSGYTSWSAVALSLQTEVYRLCRDVEELGKAANELADEVAHLTADAVL